MQKTLNRIWINVFSHLDLRSRNLKPSKKKQCNIQWFPCINKFINTHYQWLLCGATPTITRVWFSSLHVLRQSGSKLRCFKLSLIVQKIDYSNIKFQHMRACMHAECMHACMMPMMRRNISYRMSWCKCRVGNPNVKRFNYSAQI